MLKIIADSARLALRSPTVLSGASTFDSHPVLGSERLNRKGLHRWRVRTAARLTASRRRRLAGSVPDDLRRRFDENGFVVVPDALPPAEFEALRQAILDGSWEARDMTQGDTITRRVAVDDDVLLRVPALRALLEASWYRALVRYVSSFDVEPLHYLQAILRKPSGPPDPQTDVHADTFHSSMKAWLFLEDVAPGQGAFTYVRGSHLLTSERLAWEHELANSLEGRDRLTRRGSPRATADDLERMGLPAPEEVAVKANSLVVADTFGFHARGPSPADLRRVEIWAYSRRNPFLPWLGGDIFSLPAIAPRRIGWLWRLRDSFPRWLGQPWKPVGRKRMKDLP